MGAARFGKRILRVWALVGTVALVGMLGWFFVAYRATPEARAALQSDDRVRIEAADNGAYLFTPAVQKSIVPLGLVFFTGSLVEPIAYAPLARALAEAGYPVSLIPLPRRGVTIESNATALLEETMSMIQIDPRARGWVVGGHSLGAVVATRMMAEAVAMGANSVVGLILVGTTHPREVNLSSLKVPITKIVGTNDGVASYAEAEKNRKMLPAATQWVAIEGGNHSQFGWYGFQPGDSRATISAASQHEQLIRAMVNAMRYSLEYYRPKAAADSSAGRTE